VASLKRVMDAGEPAIVLASEGADFIEGDLNRLETARAQGVVHLQLVHYRVSDVGDISTDRPVHNGLTGFGRQVVAACNRLGILVDVAHCTPDGVAQALEVSTKPMVYSHGHVISTTPHDAKRRTCAGDQGIPFLAAKVRNEFAIQRVSQPDTRRVALSAGWERGRCCVFAGISLTTACVCTGRRVGMQVWPKPPLARCVMRYRAGDGTRGKRLHFCSFTMGKEVDACVPIELFIST